MQIWPWCRKEPQAPAEAAASRSASSRMISAELPPSSRCARLRWRAASSPTRRPGRGRAGEGDDPDGRLGDQRLAGVHAAGQHVQQALGQAGLLEHPGQHHAAAHRRARVGLEDHRVAQRERGRDRADGEDLREVERRDDADDPGRDALDVAQPRRARWAGSRPSAGWAASPPRRSPRWPRASRTAPRAGSCRPRGRSSPRSRPRWPARSRRPCAGSAARWVYGVAAQAGWAAAASRAAGGHVGGPGDPGPAELAAGGGLGDRRLAAGGVQPPE